MKNRDRWTVLSCTARRCIGSAWLQIWRVWLQSWRRRFSFVIFVL